MTDDLAFALGAGTLAALNPCGFAMLPAYLALFVTGDEQERPGRVAALGRALLATAAMTAGFLAVFVTFGLALTPIASTVARWLPVATVVIGVALLALGVVMLTGRTMALRTPKLRTGGNPVDSPRAMALYGVSYAIASLGCTIGPFLVVTATTFRGGDIATGVASYAAYAAGMGLVVGVLAVAAALARQSAARFLRRAQVHLTRISAALLVLAGAYVAWYGVYELRVYAGADPDDPVVAAAAQIQNTLSGWVDRLGPWPFALALLALVALSAIGVARRRRRHPDSATAAPAGGPADTGPDTVMDPPAPARTAP